MRRLGSRSWPSARPRSCSRRTPRSSGRAPGSASGGDSSARNRCAAGPGRPGSSRRAERARPYTRRVAAPLHHAIAAGARRVPGLKHLPVVKLLVIGEIALLAREHVSKLDPAERRRLFKLVRTGRGRKRNLTEPERIELSQLVAKAEPRLFAGMAVQKVSPVRLPRRIVRGPKRPKAGSP